MTSSDDLQPHSGGAASPLAAAEERMASVPLPPFLPLQQEEAAGIRHRFAIGLLERLLMVGVLALAFLLALLPARNSDVWLHLAGGRLLANGQYHFGVDPFTFTGNGVYWVNPSWLYDLLSFFLYQSGGGTALVIAKAVAIALLGWTLLRLCRTGGGDGWIAAFFTVLALLIAGSSMSLRPICVSYLFLAVTIWLIESRLAEERPFSRTRWWPVPLLFALWANLDAWFVLGPLTVVLYLLGSLLAGRRRIGQAGGLALVLLAGLAACLLNPHHYRIFALPSLFPFTAEATILRDDPIFGRLMQSPFQKDYFRFADIPDVGRMLYPPLVVLGLASFLLNGIAGARWSCLCRLPVWLFFVALSAVDASTVPLMAIVTSPLAHLNFQEYARRRREMRSSVRPSSSLWAIGGRLGSVAILVALLIAAWPGWLQGQMRRPRGWFVEIDSSLTAAVQQLAQWHRDGRLHATETGFNFSPTAAHYFAWFAPEEKSFCDPRRRPSAALASDYVAVRRALLEGTRSVATDVRALLRKHHITYLILHDSDVLRTAAVFQRLATVAGEWPILFLQGDSIVFGWRDPLRNEGADRFADWRLDFHRRAFRPSKDEKAPDEGAALAPKPAGWSSFWTTASPASSHAGDESALYLIYFDALRPSYLKRVRGVWEHGLFAGMAAAPPGLSALPLHILDFTVLQVSGQGPRPRVDGGIWPLDALAMRLTENYHLHRDDAPPGLLLLAVRAARRAINENPRDAKAYHLLGEAYLHLSRSTRERTWKRPMPSLTHVRQIQTAVALHRALLLQPDLLQAHSDLYVLYQDMGFLDLALQHLRHVLRLALAHRDFPGENRESRSDRLGQLHRMVETLDAEVRKRQDKYENQSAHRSVLDRARRAVENGLAGEALDVLLASDVAVFGKTGAEIELDLLMTVGRIDDAREWMSSSLETELGADTYHRLRVLMSAAHGDYEAGDNELAQMAAAIDRPIKMYFQSQKISYTISMRPDSPAEQPAIATYTLEVTPREIACLKLGQLLLDAPGPKQTPAQMLRSRLLEKEFLEQLQKFASAIGQQMEADVLRGALALERGNTSQAEECLHRAGSGGGSAFAAQGLLDWFARGKKDAPERDEKDEKDKKDEKDLKDR